MADMIMVASKIPIISLSSPQIISPPNPTKSISLSSIATTYLATILVTSLSSPPPLLIEEFKKVQLFDFDLTLSIMMAEFSILVFAFKLAEGRKKVEAELQDASSNLEKQKEETIKSLDSQIAALTEYR